LTSRNHDVAFKLTESYASITKAKPMGEDNNALPLLEKLGFCAVEQDATELVQALDYMPLATT